MKFKKKLLMSVCILAMVFLVSTLFGQQGKPFQKIWDEIGRIWDAIFELQGQVGGQAGFPQPNFNSEWIDITSLTDLYLVINHNLGEPVDNYVIDLQYKNLSGIITHYDYGGSIQQYSGAWWSELNNTSIKVSWREHHITGVQISEIRVRIWMYE
jgi:hypothetical protein